MRCGAMHSPYMRLREAHSWLPRRRKNDSGYLGVEGMCACVCVNVCVCVHQRERKGLHPVIHGRSYGAASSRRKHVTPPSCPIPSPPLNDERKTINQTSNALT